MREMSSNAYRALSPHLEPNARDPIKPDSARRLLGSRVRAEIREIERELRHSRFRGIRRPGFTHFAAAAMCADRAAFPPGPAALNSLLGELWAVVGLGEMGQPDGRRPGRSLDRLRNSRRSRRSRGDPSQRECGAAGVGIGTSAKHRLVMVRFQDDQL